MTAPADREAIADRIRAVRVGITDAAVAAGRAPESVRMLLATKTVDPVRIMAALDAGNRLIAENRVQEVVAKADALAGHPHESHFIGHLQSNKVNAVLPHISCLQSLDSSALARRLHQRLEAVDAQLDVLVQVNVSREATKSGVEAAEVDELVATVTGLPRLRLRGFMTVGLNSDDASAVRAGYAALRELRDRLALPGATELSMGMSGDYPEAIAEGATIVRIGSAVFGRRPTP